MRHSLKKLKESDEAEDLDLAEKKKAPRKKKEIERQPNVLGGGLVILSLIILFFAIKFNTNDVAAVAEKIAPEQNKKVEQETGKAKERVTKEIEDYSEEITEKVTDFNILGVTTESEQAKKISEDLGALEELPQKTIDTAQDHVVVKTVNEVIASVIRLRKVADDIKSVGETVLNKVEEL